MELRRYACWVDDNGGWIYDKWVLTLSAADSQTQSNYFMTIKILLIGYLRLHLAKRASNLYVEQRFQYEANGIRYNGQYPKLKEDAIRQIFYGIWHNNM
jgi:hypothetical protein